MGFGGGGLWCLAGDFVFCDTTVVVRGGGLRQDNGGGLRHLNGGVCLWLWVMVVVVSFLALFFFKLLFFSLLPLSQFLCLMSSRIWDSQISIMVG